MKRILLMLLISIPFFGLGQEWSNSFNQGSLRTRKENLLNKQVMEIIF